MPTIPFSHCNHGLELSSPKHSGKEVFQKLYCQYRLCSISAACTSDVCIISTGREAGHVDTTSQCIRTRIYLPRKSTSEAFLNFGRHWIQVRGSFNFQCHRDCLRVLAHRPFPLIVKDKASICTVLRYRAVVYEVCQLVLNQPQNHITFCNGNFSRAKLLGNGFQRA